MMGGRGGGKTSRAGTVTVQQGDKTVTQRLEIKTKQRTTADGTVQTTITIHTTGRGEVGHIKFSLYKSGVARVSYSTATIKKQGIGTKLYEAAIAKARSMGAKTFTSDNRVSTDAAGVWGRLGRTHKVKTNKHTQSSMQHYSPTGAVYEIKLK